MPRKTKPRIRRREVNAFVIGDEPSENKSAICPNGYENDMEIILVTYPKDSHFLQCPHCNTVVNRNSAKYKSFYAPLGRVEGISSPTFEVIETRRRSGIRKSGEEPFNPSEYPMCPDGTPDSDLAYYSAMGQVTSIIDEGEEEL
jgi:hypothetical protein